MIVSTITAIDGSPVTEYVGVVTGEAVLGANVFRDMFAALRDTVGGRSADYERPLRQARETTIGKHITKIMLSPTRIRVPPLRKYALYKPFTPLSGGAFFIFVPPSAPKRGRVSAAFPRTSSHVSRSLLKYRYLERS